MQIVMCELIFVVFCHNLLKYVFVKTINFRLFKMLKVYFLNDLLKL